MKTSKVKPYWLLILAAVVLAVIIVLIFTVGSDKDEVIKVGAIFTGSVADDGWNGMHYQGLSYVCEQLGTELLVKENVPEGTGRCAEAVEELVEEGAEMIILSSYAYPTEVQQTIQQYPEISFYGISAEHYAKNMTSPYAERLIGQKQIFWYLPALSTLDVSSSFPPHF